MIKGSKHNKATRLKMSLAKKGKPSNNKGIPCKESTKKKLREINTGKKHSRATIKKCRQIALNLMKDKNYWIKRNAGTKFGEDHHNWKGGKYFKPNGYCMIRVTNHPFANSNGYMLEHRYIMEQYIGRYLKREEVVHHIDGDITNNSINNLQLFESKSAHRKHHAHI